ncbi:MAG: MFS transporter [Flavobacteriales bacterium]|nr:MFS transporter [Flavobacteriales bacterium]MDG1933442.1 MFS transporter [Flavobacteriales bacterium]MDG2086098.1 MFS transporter [Flavobacteriales bacterium]|tara:strand:- start:1375 stop:2631 length:1257 start_codon:yes stop_codon:yes gene_type:complete
MIFSKIKDKKEILSWSMYDFANQPFTNIIVTFVYSAFFTKIIAENEQSGTVLWANAIAVSAVTVALLSPILGAIADNGGYRKFFLIFFTWICAVFSILLFFPQEGDVFMALSFFILANVSFEMGTVFCNSYLADFTDKENVGKISGFAWGLGFFGGLIALSLSLFLFPEMSPADVRTINILVGIWLLIFSIPTFLFVRDRKKKKFKKVYITQSFISLKNSLVTISNYKIVFQFLIARLFYNDALITIFALGGIYAVSSLDFSFSEVMTLGIVLNVAAGIGSFLFGYIEDVIGVKKTINITLIVLIFSTLLAILAPETNFPKEVFWFSGILIGLMIGPNQSCSRSLMSKITPRNKLNEFFGFFAFSGKATSFIGPLLFGLISSFYSQQIALWVVVFLFVIGLFLFNRINFKSLNLQNEI